MEDFWTQVLTQVHTYATNMIGEHPKLFYGTLFFLAIIRPCIVAFLKARYPLSPIPDPRALLARADIQAILQGSQVTKEDQEKAMSALILAVRPPDAGRPLWVSGVLASLRVITSWWEWLLSKVHIQPPDTAVTGSGEIQKPAVEP